MKKLILVCCLAGLFVGMSGAETAEPFRKKAIACSWDLGNFSFADILSNKAAFAAMPFDGARLFPNGAKDAGGKPLRVFWPMREPVWPTNVFDGLLPALKDVTAMRPFRHSFLGLSISVDKKDRLDFRDDAAWRRALGNVRLIARLARQGGCRGLIVDPEDYGGGRQYCRIEADPPFEEALPLARRRGREFSEAVFGEFPEATVLAYWLWSGRRGYLDEPGGVEAAVRRHGDLWYAFLDGVLDGISPQGRLVDGDEYSYNYEPFSGTRFTYTDCLDRNRACIAGVSPENRMKFRAHVLMGCALYLDRYTNPRGGGYYSGPISGSRLLHFDENFTAALQAADEYVWLWAEKHAWIDWKVHGPVKGIAFTEHQTWNDCLPGIYDSILSTLDPERFLTERFPALRGRATCTNVFPATEMTVSGKLKYGRWFSVGNVERADRYVIECEASGDAPGIETAFSSAKGRQWGIAPVQRKGQGRHRYLVKILPETVRTGIRCYTEGGTNAVAKFTGIAAYRLPREDGYPESGDWAVNVGGRCLWFTLDGGEWASEHAILWGGGSPMPAKVTRDETGRVILESSYSHPDHPDWAWTRKLGFLPAGGDEMECDFFETRANRPGKKDVREKGVARRLPPMGRRPDVTKLVYGEPIDLFKDGLSGWEPMNGCKSEWVFENGVLENRGSGANIRTKRADFMDFKLSYDVRVDKGCNSGVYLRGLYEIQAVDSYGKAPDMHNMGAVYGQIAPSSTADREPGVWQHVDVTLCERHVTVWLNGRCIIRNRPVRSFTGGAISTDVFAPGPMYIQGDHKGGAYRKMILTPIVAK